MRGVELVGHAIKLSGQVPDLIVRFDRDPVVKVAAAELFHPLS